MVSINWCIVLVYCNSGECEQGIIDSGIIRSEVSAEESEEQRLVRAHVTSSVMLEAVTLMNSTGGEQTAVCVVVVVVQSYGCPELI